MKKTNSYEIVRKMMYERKIRKADVIRGAGVSRPTLIKWENGNLPSLMVLQKVADYFGVSVKEFIDG